MGLLGWTLNIYLNALNTLFFISLFVLVIYQLPYKKKVIYYTTTFLNSLHIQNNSFECLVWNLEGWCINGKYASADCKLAQGCPGLHLVDNSYQHFFPGYKQRRCNTILFAHNFSDFYKGMLRSSNMWNCSRVTCNNDLTTSAIVEWWWTIKHLTEEDILVNDAEASTGVQKAKVKYIVTSDKWTILFVILLQMYMIIDTTPQPICIAYYRCILQTHL